MRPGPHHLVVAFSQVGGLHPLDLHTAQNRSAEVPRKSFLRTCETLERTTKGAYACGTSVLRGSTLLRSFSGAKLAIAGGVLWVVDSLSIRRPVPPTALLSFLYVSPSPEAAARAEAKKERTPRVEGTGLRRRTFARDVWACVRGGGRHRGLAYEAFAK